MALTFNKPEPTTPAEPTYSTDRRLYLTDEDPPRVVEEGDPAAHTLWVGEHGTVSLADAEKYGLLDHAAGTASGYGADATHEPSGSWFTSPADGSVAPPPNPATIVEETTPAGAAPNSEPPTIQQISVPSDPTVSDTPPGYVPFDAPVPATEIVGSNPHIEYAPSTATQPAEPGQTPDVLAPQAVRTEQVVDSPQQPA